MDLERVSAYLLSLDPERPEFLTKLREDAEARGIPIIREASESLIRVLLALKKPRRVLELGTAVGYSALFMALSGAGSIVTVEQDEGRLSEALGNISRAGLSERICCVKADAGAYLRELSEAGEGFDFIFLDAAKGQYLNWLPDLKTVLLPGGILLSDNVLQDGTVAESRYTAPRRDRTTHRRMREFLTGISRDPELTTAVVPSGDGMSISVKRLL